MKILKNKDNIQPAQKFNPPIRATAFMAGQEAGTCFVYDPAAWRNRNKGKLMPPSQPEKHVKSKRSPVAKLELLPTSREMRP